jgi:isopenicillin-N N-acyltransferase like protein
MNSLKSTPHPQENVKMTTGISSLRYREISAEGTPHEMGRQIGEAARQEIRGFNEVALERVNLTIKVSRERALWVAAESAQLAHRYAPHMIEELRGMAEGSGVSFDDLMLLQVRNQLRPEAQEGCTSLSIAAPADRDEPDQNDIVAQNWDNDPGLDPFTIVLTRRPVGKPALMNITQAGLIAYIGFNDAGIGLCLNSLPAPAREVGVPHYFTVRAIYESASLDEAVACVRRADRAIPANIMLATPQGPADLEVTPDDVCVLAPVGTATGHQAADGGTSLRVVTHSNHCRHPGLVHINDQFPDLIQSRARQQRIDKLLSANKSPDLKGVQSILADHDAYPRSICRHSNDDPGTGHWQTTFSVIIEAGQRRMHVSRGTPCNHPYETYVLS